MPGGTARSARDTAAGPGARSSASRGRDVAPRARASAWWGARAVRHLPLLGLLALAACSSGPSAPLRVTVPRGASLGVVAESLATRGAVSSATVFKLMGRLARVDRRLRPGLYEIPAGASIDDILAILASGRSVTVKFTVREGLALYEVAALAQEKLGLPRDSVVALATRRDAADALAPGAPSLEGFLFPDTYQVPGDATPASLLQLMTARFLEVWEPGWDARAQALGLTRLQVVTLASLVEGEARVDEERPVIAGVYYNRWKIGMALQADPTVQYAILQRTGARKPRLFLKDYEILSPFNTYLQPGFPPGPVNSPGRASLEAALAPADSRALFFVAGPDGRHRFAATLAEHNRNVAAMRRLWAEARAE